MGGTGTGLKEGFNGWGIGSDIISFLKTTSEGR
jgi:hypothetical protein